MILWEAPPTGGLPVHLRDLLGTGEPDPLSRVITEITGAENALITCSGTAALVIAFTYLQRLSARKKVIVPAYTCPLVAFAAIKAGLVVVACDNVRGGFDLDLNHLEALLDNDTLCVVATHYGGAVTDVEAVRRTVRSVSTQIYVMEDAAQAFGASWDGTSVGLAGDVGIFSFAAGKGLTIYEGGCIVSQDARLMADLRQVAIEITAPSRLTEARRIVQLVGYSLLYNPVGTALGYGMRRRFWLRRNDIARAADDYYCSAIPLHSVSRWRMSVGARASKRLAVHLQSLAEIFNEFGAQLDGIAGLNLHSPKGKAKPNCIFRFVSFASDKQCRDALDVLWPLPLGVSRPFIYPLTEHPSLKGRLALTKTPNAARLASRTIALSTSPFLQSGARHALVKTLRMLASPSLTQASML